MKKSKKILFFLLPLGLMLIFLPGCYTQVATIHDDESYYNQERQSSSQEDSSYCDNECDNWRSHQYIGFNYYYPMWQSCWGWDYCYYPTYWDALWWGPVIYPYGAYYPYHNYYGNYYNPHSMYHSMPFRHTYAYGTRNSGYQRGGNNRGPYGVVRSNPSGTSILDGRTASRGDISLPRGTGVSAQRGSSNPVSSTKVSPPRGYSSARATSGTFRPDVQQPRHRDRSNVRSNNGRMGRGSHRGGVVRGQQGTSRGYSRPSAPPATRTSSPPSNGGGERRSGGSGRSGR